MAFPLFNKQKKAKPDSKAKENSTCPLSKRESLSVFSEVLTSKPDPLSHLFLCDRSLVVDVNQQKLKILCSAFHIHS